MATLHSLAAVFLLLTGTFFLRAEETAPGARLPIEVRFVPPGADGTVSLGIYSSSGQLVRVLCDEWPFDRFRVGRDALSVEWDGRDAAGQPVAPGTYAARGFVVGGVTVQGEAFHFNDWIDSSGAPHIASIGARQLLPGGDILLAARLAAAVGALVRYSPASEVRWNTVVQRARPQPATNVQMAVSDSLAFVLLDGELQAVQLADGAAVELPVKKTGVKAVAARGSRLAVLDAAGLVFYRLPDFTASGDAGALPADLTSLALLDEGAVGAAPDGSVWLWRDAWSRLAIPENVSVREVSAARGPAFWALQEMSGGARSVAQYQADEGRLAEWVPRAEDGQLVSVCGAVDSDSFAAALNSAGVQRTVAIRRHTGGEGWEFVFDKKITASSGFGWADGKLVAASTELPEELKVPLAENPLDPAAPRALTLRAVANESGTGLATTDGLPLLRVSGEPGFGRVMLVAGSSPDTARFFQGDGACVEEYALAGLGDMMSFDAGTIEMTSGGEAPPPAAVEPPDEETPSSAGGRE